MHRLDYLIKRWRCREEMAINSLLSIKEDKSTRQVIDVLDELKVNLMQLVELGEKHDYREDLKYNGFRSFVKINRSAIDRIEKTLQPRSNFYQPNKLQVEKCLAFVRFMNKLNLLVLNSYKKNLTLVTNDINQNQSRKEYKLLFNESMTSDLFESYFSMKDDLRIYFDGHLSFYLSNRMRSLVQAVSVFVLMLSNFPFSLFILFNRQQKLNALSNAIIDSTISWPGSVEIVNKPIVNHFITMITTFRTQIESKTFFIPKQQKWILKTLDECNSTNTTQFFHYRPDQQDQFSKDPQNNSVRVRIINHTSRPKDGIVMFHVHGGAFVYHSPEAHEIYLYEFVKNVPNLYIMSVDYKLRQKYGRAHQDVLDAYLWLTSDSPDVVKLFGFKPKRFIIAGDSAGAFLSFTLCKIMRDLNSYVQKKNLNEKLVLPNTIISFYGFATLNKLSPSWLITFVETIVTLPTLRTGFGSLVFGCDEPKFFRRILFPFLVDRQERWYSSTNSKRIEYSREFVRQISGHPYLEPLDHMDFVEFQDTSLYLVTSEFDIFLDANIELANKWKGYVELNISDNASHGFLQFSLIDPISRKAVDNSIRLLKSAISKLTDSKLFLMT